MKQLSFSGFEASRRKKRTTREIFLAEVELAVPWARMEGRIPPFYERPKRGRPQMALSWMLRIYFIRWWYFLSDPGAEEAFWDMQSMREIVGLYLARDPIRDETAILNFRHLFERHNLTEALFEERAILLLFCCVGARSWTRH